VDIGFLYIGICFNLNYSLGFLGFFQGIFEWSSAIAKAPLLHRFICSFFARFDGIFVVFLINFLSYD